MEPIRDALLATENFSSLVLAIGLVLVVLFQFLRLLVREYLLRQIQQKAIDVTVADTLPMQATDITVADTLPVQAVTVHGGIRVKA